MNLLSKMCNETLDLIFFFSPNGVAPYLPSVDQTFQASETHWEDYWTRGAAIDLGEDSTDNFPASELERRIVLSQYNTAVHCSGTIPPQESGLLFNTWYGKSHLEMHWWHAVHFAAWNRFDIAGAKSWISIRGSFRWNWRPQSGRDMTGFGGRRWWGRRAGIRRRRLPPLLIWQQPHPIYYAELCYRRNPTKATLDRWSNIVFESADFMASFAALDGNGRYVLGPPLQDRSRSIPTTMETRNPTFELAYWRFGLRVVQDWRRRLGMVDGAEMGHGAGMAGSAAVRMMDGISMMEGMTDTYTKWNWEHPSLLGTLRHAAGRRGESGDDAAVAAKGFGCLAMGPCWGWDFPMAAMTAAKLNEPELAVRALVIESAKNRYLPNGHVYQRQDLPAYLPANGGLLAAVAMMAVGGVFPRDGKWSVKAEGFSSLL